MSRGLELKKIKNWGTLIFVLGYHILLFALIPLVIQHWSPWALLVFFIGYCIGGLSITVGYHRLFSHKTYKAHPAFEWLVLIASSLAFQWTAYAWSHDHRKHHNHVDTDKDPYSIKKGFWYAHVLWLFDYKREIDKDLVKDLEANPRVMFQHKYYLPLTLGVNLGVWGLTCLWMHPVTAFYFSFVLRIFCIHHSTWFINSLAHTWGAKSYAKELSAVDNALLAFVTFGEGYHNYHHAFANDYRNGIRWYHFDPTKWIVWGASKVGLVTNLRRVDRVRLQKILVSKDKKLFFDHLSHEFDDLSGDIKKRLEELSHAFDTKAAMLNRRYSERKKADKTRKKLLKVEIRHLHRDLQSTWKAWVATTQIAVNLYGLTHSHA